MFARYGEAPLESYTAIAGVNESLLLNASSQQQQQEQRRANNLYADVAHQMDIVEKLFSQWEQGTFFFFCRIPPAFVF